MKNYGIIYTLSKSINDANTYDTEGKKWKEKLRTHSESWCIETTKRTGRQRVNFSSATF